MAKAALKASGVPAAAQRKGAAAIEKKAQALGRLEVKYVPAQLIAPNSYNPNRQSDNEFALLIKSITEDGFTQPIVVVRTADRSDEHYTIVDGEHRFRAAVQLGYAEIPVAIAPMTLEQARIATLRHNRARGSEDIELATQVLRDLQQLGALDWAQDSLGLSDVEVNRLLDDIPAPEALAAEEFTPAWTPAGQAGSMASETGTAQIGEQATVSQSLAAADALRNRERAIESAKTEQEKTKAAEDNAVYRVSCIFAADEGKMVKGILGDNPAAGLLALCRAEAERRAAAEGG
jgi:ParB/RepB/Spo0J family partition protein